MDSLVDVKDIIKKINPKSEVRIDWETFTLHSEHGTIELYSGEVWKLNGETIKKSQLRKVLGQKDYEISKKEIFLEKLHEKIVPIVKAPEPVQIVAEPVKKPRKPRAPLTAQQRAACIERLAKARAAKNKVAAEWKELEKNMDYIPDLFDV